MHTRGGDLVPGVHACMHEPFVSESAVWQRVASWIDPVVDIAVFMGYIRCKASLLLSGICIYGIVPDMLADASPLVEFGRCCQAKCLPIGHYEPALL